jgi:hypothetical protein
MKQITPEKRHSLTAGCLTALSMCWVLVVHTSTCTVPDDNNLQKNSGRGKSEGMKKTNEGQRRVERMNMCKGEEGWSVWSRERG